MPKLEFTLSHGQPIWINPDKVVAVGSLAGNMGLGSIEGANIYVGVDSHWSVRESVEDVVAKIEEAKDRHPDGNGGWGGRANGDRSGGWKIKLKS